jgi:tetratricopeptide (TPR) repeat protein
MADPVHAALAKAAVANDRESLWRALEPIQDRITRDENAAHAWAEALRTSPQRMTLVEEAVAILDAFPAEPEIVIAAGAALIRSAERPIDEPPAIEPAQIAAGAAERCLGKTKLDDPRLFALRGNALRLLGPGRRDDAIAALERAIAIEPDGARWFDLALVHKHARDFASARRALEQAKAFGAPRALLFNLAIACTALGDLDAASDAWRALGMERAGDLPPVRVRLATIGSGLELSAILPDQAAGFEMVWAQPLSPCHGVIRSPTFRDAIADFGDVVLWDGAPVSVDAERVPCFPVLGVLKQGDERRFRFVARVHDDTSIDALGEALPEEIVVYRHGARVELVCPRCAAGETLIKHEHLPPEEHRVAYGKVLAPGSFDLKELARVIEGAKRPDVLMAIPSLYEAIGDTKSAGKHHKRWGEINRTARP